MNYLVSTQEEDIDTVDVLKQDPKALFSFIKQHNDGTVIHLLNRIGKLDNNDIKQPLTYLLNHPNDTIRILAVKNLAKLKDNSLLSDFISLVDKDSSSRVRRESVSAIGRLRDRKTISYLLTLLTDKDPQIITQAVRGLLNFSTDDQVQKAFTKLRNHPNESIQRFISQQAKNNSSTEKTNHETFPTYLKNLVIHGDVLKALQPLPSESIHLTFTSPPYYNARDYTIYPSYTDYLEFLVQVFTEVHRITKEGRFFILNTSPIIVPRISRSCASVRYPIPYDVHPLLVKIGWEFIDDIVWVKPEASVKNRNAGFFQNRNPLAYKPNAVTEMLMVYRKKSDKLIDWNIHQYKKDKLLKSKVTDKYDTSNVWYLDPTFDKIHSAVFPAELCRRVIRYYSFVDDLVFDPFAGSGTLGRVATQLNRFFFLTEKERKYITRMKQLFHDDTSLFQHQQQPASFMNIKDFRSVIKQ